MSVISLQQHSTYVSICICTESVDVFLIIECHTSCKLTCVGPSASDCDDCRPGWQLTDGDGCVGQ